MMRKAGKIWGETSLIHANGALEFHRIEARTNTRCSKHMHQFKWNGFFVETGHLVIRVWQDDYDLCDVTHLKPGDFMQVKPGLYHSFEALADTVAFELYWAEFNHDDIVREDVGGQTDVIEETVSVRGQPFCLNDLTVGEGMSRIRDTLDEKVEELRVCGRPGCNNITNLSRGEDGKVRCDLHHEELEL